MQKLHQLVFNIRNLITKQGTFEADCFDGSKPSVLRMDVLRSDLSGIAATRLVSDYELRRGLPELPILD